MIIIHSVNNRTILPRLLVAPLEHHLRVMPAVIVTGARQTGKSTLVRRLLAGARRYRSLDDLDVYELARRDPAALVGGKQPLAIDEVQRAPELLSVIKRVIDRDRHPGRFLFTGSANLLLMRRVSESLAGRASYLTLWPMARGEQRGAGACGAWEQLVLSHERDWLALLAERGERSDWRAIARRGGFPTPAVHLRGAEERAVWFDGYVRTYLERDLQELSAVANLPDFRRLMRAACLRLGQLVNQSEMGRDVGLPQPTVHRYLNLLETSYVLVRLPSYSVHRTKRLIKSPKLYWADTGLALRIAGETEPRGAHLENLVLGDLLVWRDARLRRPELFYWRTVVGDEVDFVIEAAGRLLPVEVKATTRPRLRDARNIRTFRREYGERARPGLLLHAGSRLEWLTEDVLAAPWWRVL